MLGGPHALGRLLAGWDPSRRILWADEELAGEGSARDVLGAAAPGQWAVLTGPEGGFSGEERERLGALAFVTPVSLGPRILRAETAAEMREIDGILYCNDGDWVESRTALIEHCDGRLELLHWDQRQQPTQQALATPVAA